MQSNDSNQIDKEQSDILSNGSSKMVDIVELKEEKEEKGGLMLKIIMFSTLCL